jgi:hypothetical protein
MREVPLSLSPWPPSIHFLEKHLPSFNMANSILFTSLGDGAGGEEGIREKGGAAARDFIREAMQWRQHTVLPVGRDYG